MTSRKRRRRKVQKPDQQKAARLYVSRGYPVTFVAEKVGVCPNTVRTWCQRWLRSDRVIARLRRQIEALPHDQRVDLLQAVAS